MEIQELLQTQPNQFEQKIGDFSSGPFDRDDRSTLSSCRQTSFARKILRYPIQWIRNFVRTNKENVAEKPKEDFASIISQLKEKEPVLAAFEIDLSPIIKKHLDNFVLGQWDGQWGERGIFLNTCYRANPEGFSTFIDTAIKVILFPALKACLPILMGDFEEIREADAIALGERVQKCNLFYTQLCQILFSTTKETIGSFLERQLTTRSIHLLNSQYYFELAIKEFLKKIGEISLLTLPPEVEKIRAQLKEVASAPNLQKALSQFIYGYFRMGR